MTNPHSYEDRELGALLQAHIDDLSDGDTSPLGTALSNIKLAQGRISHETTHRDWLIADAVERGLSIRKVSDATGLSRSAVSDIVAKAKTSAA